MTTASEVTRTYSSKDIHTLTGLSPHVLGQWVKHGYLAGSRPGSGRPREWTVDDVLKAEIMNRLTLVGFTPKAASRIADRIRRTESDGVATIDLGHALFVHQDRSMDYVQKILEMM